MRVKLNIPHHYSHEKIEVVGNEIPTNKLFLTYQTFAQQDPYRHGKVASCNRFVTQLKQWAPITNKRSTGEDGKRSRCLVIPDLETCRTFFEKQIGHKIDWDAD